MNPIDTRTDRRRPPKTSAIRCCVNKTIRPRRTQAPDVAALIASTTLAAYVAHPESAALVTGSRWPNGSVIRIGFGGGTTQALHDELIKASAEWAQYAALDFTETDWADAQVRVTCDPTAGSWSFIGTDCLSIPANQATLNLGWPDDYARSLHESGHAIGLIHEAENPLARIPWDVEATIEWYRQTQGWSRQQVIDQVLTVESMPLTNGGYDPLSIMHYPVPAALLTDPSRAVGWNQVLSDGDITFIASAYPGRHAVPGLMTEPVSSLSIL